MGRVRAAWRAAPGGGAWLHAVVLLLLLGIVGFPLGHASGFLEARSVSGFLALRIALTALVFPAAAEELVFRVLLLPHPSEHAPRSVVLLCVGISLGLFVVSHPLNGALGSPGRRATFTDPVFLCLATLLGLACTLVYLRSGSLWPPVALHWVAVVAWLLFLGGHERLNPHTGSSRGMR
jgi:predicted Abi (CAAX) family protease